MTENAAVDRDSLMERVDDDIELLQELLEIFEEDAQVHIDAMRAAASAADAVQLEKSAHSLKGSSYNMSAARLADLALELEKAGRAGELEGTGEKIDELEAELHRVIPALKNIVEEG